MAKQHLFDDAQRGAGAPPLRDLAWLVRRFGPPPAASAGIIALGLAAAVAEALGVTLVVLLLTTLIGDHSLAAATAGVLGALHARLFAATGGGTAALGLVLLGLILLKAAVGFAYAQATAAASAAITARMRKALHAHYLALPFDQFRRYDDGELTSILAQETQAVAGAHACLLRIAVNLGAVFVFGAAAVLICWPVAAIAAAGWAGLFLLQRQLGVSARRLGVAMVLANRDLMQCVLNVVSGARTLRAFGQEAREQARFAAACAQEKTITIRSNRLHGALGVLNEVGSVVVLCTIIILAVPLALPVAALLGALALLHRLQPHVQELFASIAGLAEAAPGLGLLRRLLAEAAPASVPSGSLPFSGRFEEIRFEAVGYQHANTPAPCLDGLSFSLRQGERLALLGPSGAGKSTVVNLLLRLFEPQSGRITVDGVPLPRIERGAWLSRVATAGQDAELLEGTIAENILGAIIDSLPPVVPPELGVTMTDVEAAARTAGLMDLAARLPEGLHTWIGSHGANLSGGERQRVGLARAILRRPDVLILDEATSALDLEAEAEVFARVLDVMAGRTILVISHRPQALDWVDRIVRLSDGRAPDRADLPPVSVV